MCELPSGSFSTNGSAETVDGCADIDPETTKMSQENAQEDLNSAIDSLISRIQNEISKVQDIKERITSRGRNADNFVDSRIRKMEKTNMKHIENIQQSFQDKISVHELDMKLEMLKSTLEDMIATMK